MTSKAALVLVAVTACIVGTRAEAQTTMTKQGTNASGQTCTVTVTRNPDGSISTAGAGGSSVSTGAGGVSSSSSAGGTSVQVQAGGGSVSSSTTMPGGSGGASASVVTVNGCTISTTSP